MTADATRTSPGETTAVIALRPVGSKYRGRQRCPRPSNPRPIGTALGVLLAAVGVAR